MRRPLLTLTLLVALGGLLLVRGQDAPPKSEADPFDLVNRRPRSPQDVDRDLLAKHSIETSGEALVAYFVKRTLPDDDRAKVEATIRLLGSPQFKVREKASSDLIDLGPPILELLRKGAASEDLEISRRSHECAERIRGREPRNTVTSAAVRVLALREAPGAAAALLGYLPYADHEDVADAARAALQKIAVKDGKADPDLVAALKNPMPIRRAAAGAALAGVKDQTAAVKVLLKDGDPLVRLRVAQALVEARDKSAVPALIEALPHVAARHAWAGEELLLRMSEGKSPPLLARVGDDATRTKYVAGWNAWWAKHEKDVDLAKLQIPTELLGHTIVVLLDVGRIQELNAKNDVVWHIEGLVFPLDVQYLANGNVLVAEYHAGRVTERDRARGDIRWQKDITGPLVAQRLPNRHTFIATDSQFIEVDEKGEEVSSFGMPSGERVMKANRLPNGEVVALTNDARVVRLDSKGKELNSFDVDLSQRLFGGKIDVLPNGRVLVPHNRENKVVEYDMQGRAVWEVSVTEPVAATRLPNGNTLVTTMQPQTGAIEFDRDGAPTGWSYRNGSRVTRAIRR